MQKVSIVLEVLLVGMLLFGCTSQSPEAINKVYANVTLQSLGLDWQTFTSAKKVEVCNSLKGKYVQWTAIIEDVNLNSEYHILAYDTHYDGTKSDVGIQLLSDSKECAKKFNIGDVFSFEGKIVKCSNSITGDIFYLQNGVLFGCTGTSSTTPSQFSQNQLRIQACENKTGGMDRDECYFNIVRDNAYSSQDEGYNICNKINPQDQTFASPCNKMVTYR